MVNLYKIPIKAKPLAYIKGRALPFNRKGSLILVPTKRNLRTLASLHNWELDIQTVSEFTSRSAVYEGILLPVEMRTFYLYKALSQLSFNDMALVLKNKGSEIINYINFLKKSSAILPFYRELAAEGIDRSLLVQESLYQDYEEQVKVLSGLWDIYCGILKSMGYTDEWEYYKNPVMDFNYINRYDHIIFLSSGYLANYEITQLKTIGELKNLDIYFNFTGEFHPQHSKLQEEFGVMFSADEDDGVPVFKAIDSPQDLYSCTDGLSIGVIYNDRRNIHEKAAGFPFDIKKGLKSTEIVPCASAMAQFDLITSRIYGEHFNNGIPFNKMAVVLPGEGMLPWFNYSDRLMLYNISGGRSVTSFIFFHHISALSDLIKNMDGGFLDLKYLELFISSGYFKADYSSALYDMKRRGTLYIEPEKLRAVFWHEIYSVIAPFLDPFSTYPMVISNLSALLTGVLNEYVIPSNPFGGIEVDALVSVLEELDKMRFLYKDISDRMPVSDVISLVLGSVSSLSAVEGNGSVPVIGLLESRNMQFDYVFVPDLNSDVFPAVQQKDFFLNTQVRNRMKLPTANDRENLQKNYLYQIIARAKQSLLTYTDNVDTQPSSFVSELLAGAGAKIIDKDSSSALLNIYSPSKFMTLPVSSHAYKKYRFDILRKDRRIKDFLAKFTYSATSLDIYRKCPLQFFFKYVKNFKPREEPVEDADMRVLGEKLHQVMEILYKDGVSALSEEYLERMESVFDRLIEPYDYFSKNAVGIFQTEALKKQFKILAAQEKERLLSGAEIQGFEVEKTSVISGVRVYGKIDRLDISSSGYSIIDYKYKKIDPVKNLKSFEDIEIQLPVYALVMLTDRGSPPSEILWFDMKEGQGFVEGFPPEMLDEFNLYLDNFIQGEVLGSDVFNSASNPEICKYCAYNGFCPRALI